MGKKILLADDSITIQKVIELTFSDEDFEVVTVGNGRLAIERVQEVRPDLVLCDIIMPEKDGYEVCDFIKKNPSLSHIPVLLLTGAFEPFDQERAARVGCDGFLAKPFEPQTLIAKVKDLLSQAASRAAAARPVAAAPSPAPATPPPVPVPPRESMASAFAAPAIPPPPAPAPPAPVSAESAPAPEPEVSFISDEQAFPEASFEGGPAAAYPEPEPVEAPPEELYSPIEDMATPDDELMSVSPEESASLQVEPPPPRMLEDETPAPWSQPTIEVPLEDRAQASVESAEATMFEEVFEDETPAPAAPPSAPEPIFEPIAPIASSDEEEFFAPVATAPAEAPAPAAEREPEPEPFPEAAEMLSPSAGPAWTPPPAPPAWTPAPPPPPPPAWTQAPAPPAWTPPPPPEIEKRAPEPAEEVAAAEESFADLAPAPTPPTEPAAPSVAAEVPVPVDMVEKIAQRVVAQISEKVIREIAWEVIPELAESLIKKEIERLKAELQQT